MNTLCLASLYPSLKRGENSTSYQYFITFSDELRGKRFIFMGFHMEEVYSLGHNKISRNLYVPIQLYVEWPKNPLCQISEKFLSCENRVAKTKDDGRTLFR